MDLIYSLPGSCKPDYFLLLQYVHILVVLWHGCLGFCDVCDFSYVQYQSTGWLRRLGVCSIQEIGWEDRLQNDF